jgi:hypothetical protein
VGCRAAPANSPPRDDHIVGRWAVWLRRWAVMRYEVRSDASRRAAGQRDGRDCRARIRVHVGKGPLPLFLCLGSARATVQREILLWSPSYGGRLLEGLSSDVVVVEVGSRRSLRICCDGGLGLEARSVAVETRPASSVQGVVEK